MIKRTFTPYIPSIKSYPILSSFLSKQLLTISRSNFSDFEFRPAKVVLDNYQVIENVCLAKASDYIEVVGVWPEDDSNKNEIDILRVESIESSTNRLPEDISKKLYKAGETVMGGIVFTVVFSDKSKQVYEFGNVVDFITFPEGKSFSDVVDILPHQGTDEPHKFPCPDYYWCLYD